MDRTLVTNQSLVSVIIPVYNVEKYINKCIESVLKQKYTNIEILLINDGSSDNSGKICDEYLTKDDRIRVYHIINSGASNARNYGIKNAKGKYIVFIDSDDTVEENYVKDLVDSNYRDDYDLIICGLNYVFTTKNGIKIKKDVLHNNYLTNDIRRDYSNIVRFLYSACLKLFKSEIIKEYNILFRKDLITAEDQTFVQDYLLHVKKYKFLNKALYNYYCRNNNSLSSKTSMRHLESDIRSIDLKKEFLINMGINNVENIIENYIVSLVYKYAVYSKDYRCFKIVVSNLIKISKFDTSDVKYKRKLFYLSLKKWNLPAYIFFRLKYYYFYYF